MSTSKHIDKICLAAIAIILVVALLFSYGPNLGITFVNPYTEYQNRLFDTSKVHTIDITMDDWDSFIENCESEEYSACSVTIDGESFKNIAIRAKGNTSLSSVSAMGSQRYSLKLEFDHYTDGNTYYGLDKLCLNNLIQDNTMMKDYLVYQMMAEFGVDTPLCSFVYITVNGEDWGLYLAVEGVEDSFLQRNYGTDTGELYKPDSMSFGAGRGNGKEFNMDDLDLDNSGDSDSDNNSTNDSVSGDGGNSDSADNSKSGEDATTGATSKENGMPQMPGGGDLSNIDFSNIDFSNFNPGDFSGNMPEMPEMPEGDINLEDVANMIGSFGGMGSDDVKLKYSDDDIDSYPNIFDNAKTDVSTSDKKRLIASLKNLTEYTDLENTVNIDEVLRYFVVHNFVVNGDSYTGTIVHNYYLHEKDGQLEMIPWDYNLAFGTFTGGDASSSVNSSIDNPVSGGSVDDRPMIGWIFSSDEYTQQYHDLFSEFISEWIDGGKLAQMIEDTANMIRPYVDKDPTKFCTSEEFETGVSTLSEFVSLRGQAVANQLAGDDTEVDASSINTSDMGSMGSTMGGNGGGPGGFGGFGSKSDSDSNTDAQVNNDSNTDAQVNTDNKLSGSSASKTSFSGKPDMTSFDPSSRPDSGVPDIPGFEQTNESAPDTVTGATNNAGTDTSDSSAEAETGDAGTTESEDKTASAPSRAPDFNAMQSSGSSEITEAIQLGAAAIILLLGLAIAIKKKY